MQIHSPTSIGSSRSSGSYITDFNLADPDTAALLSNAATEFEIVTANLQDRAINITEQVQVDKNVFQKMEHSIETLEGQKKNLESSLNQAVELRLKKEKKFDEIIQKLNDENSSLKRMLDTALTTIRILTENATTANEAHRETVRHLQTTVDEQKQFLNQKDQEIAAQRARADLAIQDARQAEVATERANTATAQTEN